MDIRDIPMWHDAKLDPPGKVFDCKEVLTVQRRNGRDYIEFGKYIYGYNDNNRWLTQYGRSDVIYWMPLPKMPKVGVNVILHTEYVK